MTGSLFLLILGTSYYLLVNRKKNASSQLSTLSDASIDTLKTTLEEVLLSHGISWNILNGVNSREEFWQVKVPADLPVPSLHLEIQEAVGLLDAKILFAESEPISEKITLQVGWQDSCLFRIQLFPLEDMDRENGRIALLIDDFGDRWDPFVESFLDLDISLTVSIIPGQNMSSKVASEMRMRGCEVILHLPMEPISASFQDNGYIILASMNQQEIINIIKRSLDSVPGVVGVNNHMGSKVTADRELMTIILSEIGARGLYFVDSRTIATTVAYDVAKSLGLRCSKRDVFIDAEKTKADIRSSIWDLAEKAKTNGYAIGIGHCQTITLEVLQEEIPKIKKLGFHFVPLSKVVR